jgi:hypothetical protein
VVWRCFHKHVLTDDNLIKQGCIIVSGFSLCIGNYECTTHLFLHCSFAQLWLWLDFLLLFSLDCTSMSSLFQSIPSSWNVYAKHLATISLIHVFHRIWMAHNRICFSKVVIQLHAAKVKVLTAIKISAPMLSGNTSSSDFPML